MQSGRHHLNDRAAANRALNNYYYYYYYYSIIIIIIIITLVLLLLLLLLLLLYNQSQFPDTYWIFRVDWALLHLFFLAVVELLAITPYYSQIRR